MKLIVGLGNPGEQYDHTRHNLGVSVVDELRRKLELGDWQNDEKLKSHIIKSPELILAFPQTFMNKSGLAVAAIATYYKIAPEDVVVVHDELDLLLGHIKVRIGGAAAGHHGVESVIESLGTDNFIRVRLGIGVSEAFLGEHKKVSFSAEHFVLEPFMDNERPKVKTLTKHAIQAIQTLLEAGLEKTQNQYN